MKFKIYLLILLSFVSFNGLFAQLDTAVAERLSCSYQYDSIQKRNIYIFADEKAEYPGGSTAMNSFIQQNLKYPEGHLDAFGSIFIQFIVETDGRITNKSVRRSFHPQWEVEAMRVIDLMPKWIPANCDGILVPYLVTIPVKIYLR